MQADMAKASLKAPATLLLIPIVVGFGFSGLCVPRLSPAVPSLDSFRECKKVSEPAPFFYGEICVKADTSYGLPVDGDKLKRHFAWRLIKLTGLEEHPDASNYSIQQIVFDCRLNEGQERQVQSLVFLRDQPPKSAKTDINKWSPSNVSLGYMQTLCPAKEGFTKIGDSEFGLKYAIRSGSLINVETKFSDGREATLVIDCRNMLFGIDSKPSKPIRPRSNGFEVFRRLCK